MPKLGACQSEFQPKRWQINRGEMAIAKKLKANSATVYLSVQPVLF
jgi:hypothetical protein